MQFIKRVVNDIRSFRHIEVYALSFAAFAVALIAIFADAMLAILGDNIVNSIILAALGVLVLQISSPKSSGTSLDEYLNDRSSLGDFAERIKGAKQLYIYAPSAANLLRGGYVDAIRKEILSQDGGELKVVIQNPTEEAAVDILVRQLDEHTKFQVQHLRKELVNTIEQMQLIESWDTKGVADFRVLDFSPGFSLVIIDADRNNGHLILETHGFENTSTPSRMHVLINKKDSERWFEYWTEQFKHIWKRSHELGEVDIQSISSDNGSA